MPVGISMKNFDDYRPAAFWGFNDDLSPERTQELLTAMKDANIGTVLPHARGGLKAEYMGDRWMAAFRQSVSFCKNNGMNVWFYDEKAWPSGYAGGKVNELGEKYQQKYLRTEKIMGRLLRPTDKTLAVYDNEYSLVNVDNLQKDIEYFHVFLEICPFYVDILDRETISEFIKTTYDKYFECSGEEFGVTIAGAFTDEPQYSRAFLPWSNNLAEEFFRMNGYNLIDGLYMLYFPASDYKRFRLHYWSVVNKMFVNNYTKQISDWCRAHDILLTGHCIGEEDLFTTMQGGCGVMAHLAHYDIPGLDIVGGDVWENPVTLKEAVSVGAQMGKKRIMSEMFAGSGYGMSIEQFKFMIDFQLLFGMNMPVYSILPNSIAGARKRDWPPCFTPEQKSMKIFSVLNKYTENVCRLMGKGQEKVEIGVIHPLRTAWALYSPPKIDLKGGVPVSVTSNEQEDTKLLTRINNDFLSLCTGLANEHYNYHLIDETILESHGSAGEGCVNVGKCTYSCIIIPEGAILSEYTQDILSRAGVKTLSGGNLDALSAHKDVVCDNDKLFISKRSNENEAVYMLLNRTAEHIPAAEILLNKAGGAIYEYLPKKDEYKNICYENAACGIKILKSFSPFEAIFVVQKNKRAITGIKTEIKFDSPNCLVLDRAKYSVDGFSFSESLPIYHIQQQLILSKYSGEIQLKFEFIIEEKIDGKMLFAAEKIEDCQIQMNKRLLSADDFSDVEIDPQIKGLDISDYICPGNNEIIMSMNFYCSDKMYSLLTNPNTHETVMETLTYDVELENVYILGDFCLSGAECGAANDEYLKISAPFSIKAKKDLFDIRDITSGGYYFYYGNIICEKTFPADDLKKRYILSIPKAYAHGFEVKVNGMMVDQFLESYAETEISEFLKRGENKVEIILYAGMRNLIGPHHHRDVDPRWVNTESFTGRKNLSIEGLSASEFAKPEYYVRKFGLEDVSIWTV